MTDAKEPESVREVVADYLKSRYSVTHLTDDMTLGSLGIDSVESVNIAKHIASALKMEVPATLLWECETIADLQKRILGLMNAGAQTDAELDIAFEVDHPFARYVNPHIASKLASLNMDKRFVRGEGIHLWDDQEQRYYDFMSQYGALPFGHNPDFLWEMIADFQQRKMPVFVQPSLLDGAGLLAAKLLEIAPQGLRYATFTNSGAEAVEVAIKLARLITGRTGILSTVRGFHGKTVAALSATGNSQYQAPYALPLAGFDAVPYDDVPALEAALAAEPCRYAAYIVEPIQGEGGIVVPAPDYLRNAKAVCEKYGVLFIVDEIQTGLGRTGALFASDDDLEPDVLLVAKALGGGLIPIGACLYRQEHYREAFALTHSSTFAAGGLSCRVGIAVIDALLRNQKQTILQVESNGCWLRAELERLQQRFPHILAGIRGRGFMLGLYFELPKAHWKKSLLHIASQQNLVPQLVASYLLNVEKIRVAPTLNQSKVLRIQPPLNATKADCVVLIEALERCLKHLDSADLGSFFGSILDGRPRAFVDYRHRLTATADAQQATTHEVSRFGFLMHPLTERSYIDFDASLGGLDQDELVQFARSLDGQFSPFVCDEAVITDAAGNVASGVFITLSHTTEALKKMPPAHSLSVIREAVELARTKNVEIVGLGAYTSILSGGGLQLVDQAIPLTSGNAFTAVSGIEAIEQALALRKKPWRNVSAAIVGAAGAIGSACSVTLAAKASRLILVGNAAHNEEITRRRLEPVVARIVAHYLATDRDLTPGSVAEIISLHVNAGGDAASAGAFLLSEGVITLSASPSTLAYADIVITATNSLGNVCAPKDLRRGAIVCDLSRPRSFDEHFIAQRPDVLILDGGLIQLPTGNDLHIVGLAPGQAYACMAETMLLCLNNHLENTSLGATISVSDIEMLQSMARNSGFKITRPLSFGKEMNVEVAA